MSQFEKKAPQPTNPVAKNPATAAPARADVGRRSFGIKVAAGIIGALVAVVPLFAGIVTFFDPLFRRRAGGGKWVRIATLDALPKVGEIYRFPVITERDDKWTLYPPGPIGAVFLRRVNDRETPLAFTTDCPHLGCSVDFRDGIFKCPCHNSTWTLDGARINPESCPSPRDLDELKDVELRNENEVWVRFKRFRAGIADQVEA